MIVLLSLLSTSIVACIKYFVTSNYVFFEENWLPMCDINPLFDSGLEVLVLVFVLKNLVFTLLQLCQRPAYWPGRSSSWSRVCSL